MTATKTSAEDVYDVAIVGGGPAGLSAALWLGRYLHSVVLIDSGDPRNWETRGVKCKRDEAGLIVNDDHYHTSVLNVFAAGDIVPGPQLAVAAASDGAIAALAIHASLVPEARKLD